MRGVSIGIDVGTGSVTTVVLRKEKNGELRLLGVGKAASEGMRKGAVGDPEALSRSIKKSAHNASRASNISVRSGVVAFGGSSVRSSLVRGVVAISRADGEITGEDVRRSIQAAESFHPKSPNRETVHILPRQFWIDGEGNIQDPVGMVGMRLEVEALIIDGEKRSLSNLVKAFDQAGIDIDDLIFSPIAASLAVLTPEQKELGVMLLDIGAGTSDYAIFREGTLVDAGIIPVGGDLATQDIAQMFKTRVDVAEKIKQKYGHAIPDAFSKGDVIRLAEFIEDENDVYSQRELAEVIRARMADIFELAEKALRQNARALALPAGVIIVGGSSLLPGLREFAKKEMRLLVERGVVQGIRLDEALGGGATIATALGAALKRLDQPGGFASAGSLRPIVKIGSLVKNWLKIFMP